MQEPSYLDNDQKFWLVIVLGIVTLVVVLTLGLVLIHSADEAIRVNAGLQQCKVLLPGMLNAETAWMKECPKVNIDMQMPSSSQLQN